LSSLEPIRFSRRFLLNGISTLIYIHPKYLSFPFAVLISVLNMRRLDKNLRPSLNVVVGTWDMKVDYRVTVHTRPGSRSV